MRGSRDWAVAHVDRHAPDPAVKTLRARIEIPASKEHLMSWIASGLQAGELNPFFLLPRLNTAATGL